MTMKAPRSVFVSHSPDVSLESVFQVLSAAGIEYRDSFGSMQGDELSAGVIGAIRKADAVIVVLHQSTPNIMFEAGCASALQKPLLLICPPSEPPPPFLGQSRQIVAEKPESPVVALAVKAFV